MGRAEEKRPKEQREGKRTKMNEIQEENKILLFQVPVKSEIWSLSGTV